MDPATREKLTGIRYHKKSVDHLPRPVSRRLARSADQLQDPCQADVEPHHGAVDDQAGRPEDEGYREQS